MAISGGEVEYKFSADTSEVVAAAQRIEESVSKAMDESAKATDELSRSLAAQEAEAKKAAQATVKLTDAEKKWLAQTLAAEAAEKAKAEAIGITVSRLRQMEAATKKAAEAEEAATKAAREMGEAHEKAATKVDDLSDHAGKAGGAMGKLAGAAELVSPGLADLLRNGADIADVFEVIGGAGSRMATIIGGIAVPVGIAAAAIASMVAVVDDYAESKREAIRVTEQFAEMMKPLDTALESAKAEHALLTQAQLAGKDALKEYTEVAAIHSAVDAKVAEATAVAREEREKLTAALAKETKQHGQAAIIARDRIAKLDREIGFAEEQGRQLKQLGEANRAIKEGIEGGTGAKKDNAKVTKEANDEEKRQIEELRASLAKREEQRKQEAAFIQMSAESEMRGIFAVMDAEAELAKKRKEEHEKEVERLKKEAEEREKIQRAQVVAASDTFGAIASIAATARSTMSEEDKDAAMTAFGIEKAAGIAQATINAALAVSEAIASAPPPLNIPSIIAATASGAASIASIAAVPPPKFHVGTSRVGNSVQARASMMAGEVATVLTTDEAVLTGSAADRFGRKNIDRANAGMDPFADRRTGGGNYAVIGARAHGYFIRDDVRQRTPLAEAIRSNSGVRAGLRHR